MKRGLSEVNSGYSAASTFHFHHLHAEVAP